MFQWHDVIYTLHAMVESPPPRSGKPQHVNVESSVAQDIQFHWCVIQSKSVVLSI